MSEPVAFPLLPQETLNGFVAAAQLLQDAAIDAWNRECDMYARYFGTLSRVPGVGGLLLANAELLSQQADANVTNLQRLRDIAESSLGLPAGGDLPRTTGDAG